MAYAALVNLEKAIDQILPNEQHYMFLWDKHQMQSLHEKIILFQEFLEDISGKSRLSDIDELESRIRDVSYRLEDIVESIPVQPLQADQEESESEASSDGILGWCLDQNFENNNYSHLPVTVRAAAAFGNCVKEADLLLEEAMEMKRILDNKVISRSSINSHSTASSSSLSGPPSATGTTVGLDDPLTQILLQIITGRPSMFQVVPITGMGGIGKTTLARTVFEHPRTVRRFDVRLWATVSQEFKVKQTLQGLLLGKEEREKTIGELIVSVHQRLQGRRYLIVVDDVWNESVRNAFPDDNNYSRVVLTTRLSKVAMYVTSSSHVHQMQLLNEEQSWDLLRETVYGNEAGCPGEFEDMGRTISKSCKGLPPALVVIGGLLKFNKAKDYWQEVAASTTIKGAANDESLLGVLSLSYANLPPHLKACFLYLVSFPEDRDPNKATCDAMEC